MISDPDRHHICEGSTQSAVVVDQMLKAKRVQIAQTGKRPRAAYREVLTDAVNSFDPEVAVAVEGFGLTNPPWTGDPVLDDNLQASVRDYFTSAIE